MTTSTNGSTRNQMPGKAVDIASVITLCMLLTAAAEPPMLQPAQFVNTSASPIDLGDHAIPWVTDWNGDGHKDLIVGYRYADKIAFYPNVGTDAQPVFTNFTHIQAGGVDIFQAGAGCGAPAPCVVDYNADGKRDLLVGNGANGTVYYYQNTNSDTAPMLASGVPLLLGGSPLSVSSRATPFVHDWDEDGLMDLFCGSGVGYVYYFRNVGTAQNPTYSNSLLLVAGGVTLNLGARSVVRVVDWDSDGLKDLVGSSSTGVYWCRNTGNNPSPVLQAPEMISAPVSGSGLIPINTGYRMRLHVVDWNNDNILDLLLGNADGTLFLYEGYPFAIRELATQLDGQVTLRWNSAPFLNYHVLTGTQPDEVLTCVVSNLPSGGKLTSWTNGTISPIAFFRVQLAP